MKWLNKFGWLRVIQFTIGLWFLVSGLMYSYNLQAFLGVIFLIQAVFNVGCFANSCNISSSANTKKHKDIEYEEVS